MSWIKKIGKKIKKSLGKYSRSLTNRHAWTRATHKFWRSVRNRTKRKRNIKAIARMTRFMRPDDMGYPLGAVDAVTDSSALADANAYVHNSKTLAQMMR